MSSDTFATTEGALQFARGRAQLELEKVERRLDDDLEEASKALDDLRSSVDTRQGWLNEITEIDEALAALRQTNGKDAPS